LAIILAKHTFISWNVNGIRAVDKKGALKWIDEEEVEQIPDSILNMSISTKN